jgi:hypothetical protein
MTLELALRLAGLSLVALSLFHAVLWRTLDWGLERAKLSPLTGSVFAVHTFFIAFVLLGLGWLSLARPELLLARSELARVLLWAVVLFWAARLAAQPLVFDRVMREGWTRHPIIRFGSNLIWLSYVAVYGAALLRQL